MLTTLQSFFSELTLSLENADDLSPANEWCGICFETMDDSHIYSCTDCAATFCGTCMRFYIGSKVQYGLVTSQYLICPEPKCAHALSETFIQSFATAAAFHKHKTFLKNQTLGIRYCPRATCSAALEEPRRSRHRRVNCDSCRQESCMRCGETFHRIPICRRMNKELREWKKLHRMDARSCPSCKVAIEKNGGCKHMTCAHCEHQFCWICMRPWTKHSSTWCKWKAFSV